MTRNKQRKRQAVAKTLVEFLTNELKTRGMSARQFADFLDVAPSTVTTYMNPNTKAEPTLTFLRKLAQRTETPLAVIIALAYPEVAPEISDLPPDVLLLASRLANLPEPTRNIIRSIIESQK